MKKVLLIGIVMILLASSVLASDALYNDYTCAVFTMEEGEQNMANNSNVNLSFADDISQYSLFAFEGLYSVFTNHNGHLEYSMANNPTQSCRFGNAENLTWIMTFKTNITEDEINSALEKRIRFAYIDDARQFYIRAINRLEISIETGENILIYNDTAPVNLTNNKWHRLILVHDRGAVENTTLLLDGRYLNSSDGQMYTNLGIFQFPRWPYEDRSIWYDDLQFYNTSFNNNITYIINTFFNSYSFSTNLFNLSSVSENQITAYSFNLTFDYKPVVLTNVTAYFYFNNTFQPLTAHYNTSDTWVFEVDNVNIPFFTNYTLPINVNSFWNYTIETSLSNKTYSTPSITQSVNTGLEVGVCNDSVYLPIVNFTYFDDVSNDPIQLKNSFDLSFFDGTNTISVEGAFEGHNNDSLCTNLPPNISTYNWETTGLITLTKDDYVTRVFSYPTGVGFISSNNPTTTVPLSLVSLGNSSTVTYTWFTTTYDLVDGVMTIYRCDNGSSKTMIETTSIASGIATANIILVTQPYSYDVTIDGVTYEQNEFTDCHVETTTERTYYVNILGEGINPVLGLFLIDCSLVNESDNQVTLNWNDNTQSGISIQGCVVGYGASVSGQTELFRECSNTTTNTLTVTIPDNPEILYLRGELTQGSSIAFCQNQIQLRTGRTNVFLGMGLFAATLMVLAMTFYFAGNNEASLIGAGVGLLLGWIIGFIAVGWFAASSALVFILLILFIGRNVRKRSQE